MPEKHVDPVANDINIVSEERQESELLHKHELERAQDRRESYSHLGALALLLLIAGGSFWLVVGGYSDKTVDFATHTLTTIVTALVAYLYVRKSLA